MHPSDINFQTVSPFNSTPVTRIRLGHADIVDHSVQFIDTRLKKSIKKKGMDEYNFKKKSSINA